MLKKHFSLRSGFYISRQPLVGGCDRRDIFSFKSILITMAINNVKALLVPLLFLSLLLGAASCSGLKGTRQMTYDTVTTMSGLRYIDYEKGTGAKIEPGMNLSVDYAGYLLDGTLFDTSLDSVGHLHDKGGKPFAEGADRTHYFDRGGYPFQPIEFVVGQGQVIRGWDEGLTTNMQVGGRRRLIIPAPLAYGERAMGPIPPNSTLVFDIHVLSAK
jgi:hypothetical protein